MTDNLAPPAGVPLPEANQHSLDTAAAAIERIMFPSQPRAADGRFAPASPPPSAAGEAQEAERGPPSSSPPPEQPPEGKPNAAVEGETVEEDRFEIDLGDGQKQEVSASELAEMVRASRAPKSTAPPAVSEEVIRERAAVQAEKEAIARERQHYAQQLAQFIPAAQAQLQSEFSDVKSIHDLQRLAVEDPARYVRWQAAQNAIAAAQAEQQQMQQKFQSEHEARMRKYTEEQNALLAKAVPEFSDPAKAAVEKKALRDYLGSQGFADDELAQLVDHRTVVVARKAMLYDRMMAAKPEAKKVAPVVRAIRPGASRPTPAAPNAAQARDAAMKALQKDGSVDSLAALIRAQGVR